MWAGEKAGRLLFHQIRRAASSRLIAEIRTASGEILTDQQKIHSALKYFYTNLYTSESRGDPALIGEF